MTQTNKKTAYRFYLLIMLAVVLIIRNTAGVTEVLADTISISEVRKNNGSGIPLLLGQIVTVAGEVTVSDQLGIKAAIQDETAGVILYDAAFADSVEIGEIVTVTGTVTQYAGLTELDPVTIIDRMQHSPTIVPQLVTCNDLATDGRGGLEKYEGKLVRLNNVSVNTAVWNVSTSGSNFTLTDASGTCQIRIDKYTNIANTLAPQTQFDVIGVVGQYDTSAPHTSGYQLMPRFNSDLIVEAGPQLLTGPEETELTPNGLTIGWETVTPGNSIILYGETTSYEIDSVTVEEAVTAHSYRIEGLSPATAYHIKVGSSDGNGTSFTADHVAMTSSDLSSTGAMHVYFNRSVDTTLASDGNIALGNQNLAEKFIDRVLAAQYSIDVCFYSWNLTSVTNALIDARNRGVSVRFIHDDDHLYQDQVNRLMGAGIRVINDSYGANDGMGLQHNKFAIFDARDNTYADDDWVWTGSLNMTDYSQSGINAMQNVIEIQDQSLARAYTMEFNEMWGSDGSLPSASNSRFGVRKADDTPHKFVINGIPVENYMSPSDHTTSKIINAVQQADHELYFCILEFTRIDLKMAMADPFFNLPGFQIRGVFDSSPDPASQWESMSGLGPYAWDTPADIWLDRESGIMHHKYLIVDPEHVDSNPILITGSSNWTSSGENRNNENILIIHDTKIANLYLQEFAERYHAAGGTGDFIASSVKAVKDGLPLQFQLDQNYPNPFNASTVIGFSVEKYGQVVLDLYNVRGQHIETLLDRTLEPQSYIVPFSGEGLPSGIYFYKLRSHGRVVMKKMALIK